MKKIKYLFVMISMLFVLPTANVSAKEEYTENEYMSNVEVLETNRNGTTTSFSFYSSLDDITYLVHINGNQYEYYNFDTNEYITKVIINDNKEQQGFQQTDFINGYGQSLINNFNIYSSSNVDNYESWSNYVFVTDYEVDVSAKNMTTSIILSAIGIKLRIAGAALSAFHAIATYAFDNAVDFLTIYKYNKWNTHCGILVINKYDSYETNGGFINSIEQQPTWLSSPYDYTQPAECRILAQRY